MPNRVIREALLDSERYWSCTIEARELYRHLQLLADDLGCVSLAPVFLRRRCFDGAPSNDKIWQLLQQLSDHDLVRIYEVDFAKYGFLPRFGQRLRRMHLKHPRPPSELLKGDPEAIEKFSKINGKLLIMTDVVPSGDWHVTAEEKRSEEKRREVEEKRSEKPQASGSSITGGFNVKNVLQKMPSETTPESVEKNRRIAQAVASGDIDLARQIRDET